MSYVMVSYFFFSFCYDVAPGVWDELYSMIFICIPFYASYVYLQLDNALLCVALALLAELNSEIIILSLLKYTLSTLALLTHAHCNHRSGCFTRLFPLLAESRSTVNNQYTEYSLHWSCKSVSILETTIARLRRLDTPSPRLRSSHHVCPGRQHSFPPHADPTRTSICRQQCPISSRRSAQQ